MAVHITKEFLNDLREADDLRFVRQVLNHTIDRDGDFADDKDDHRYKDIDDAWIRCVSKGATAFRVIFIRKGSDIYLYRAGHHDIEDHLAPARSFSSSITLAEGPIKQPQEYKEQVPQQIFLKNSEPAFINKFLISMYHLRHHEIYIVSPFLDLPILSSKHHFGRFLDKAKEEGTDVILITLPPKNDDEITVFRDLELRDIRVFFLPRLHTKLYIFNVDLESRTFYQRGVFGTAVLGSSNLTCPGLGFDELQPNEELCSTFHTDRIDELKDYVLKLMFRSQDFTDFMQRRRRQQR